MEDKQSQPEQTGGKRNELGQFIPGVSGHPEGRPKGTLSVVAELKKQLEQIAEEDPQKRTKLELLVRKVLLKALNDGDTKIIRDIIDRVDGKPKQSIELDDKRVEETKESLQELLTQLKNDKE